MNDFRPTHMKIIKSLILHFSLILMVLSGISCNSDIYGTGPATQRGSVAGGITGAALGAIVGNQSGRPLEGAALGGLIGAAAGSALGNANDQENGYSPPRRYRYVPPPPVVYYDYHSYRPIPPRRYCPPRSRNSFYFSYKN